MPRVLYITDSLRFGGAERQLVELVRGLDKERYSCQVVSVLDHGRGYEDLVTECGVASATLGRHGKLDVIGPVVELCRLIRKDQIDIVHAVLPLGSFFGVVGAKLTGRPVICSVVRSAAHPPKRRARFLVGVLSRLADRFVSNSKAGFTNRFRKERSNFRVIYNGLDFSRFSGAEEDPAGLLSELQIGGMGPVVGMVASLTRHKDQETLIRAAKRIIARFPKVCFLLVGDGPNRGELETLVASLRLDGNVRFTGYRSDVDRLYHVMDVCVLLSDSRNHLEGISNALLEAMINGVPVVASRGGGTDEIIRDGETGILVPPRDAAATAQALVRVLEGDEQIGRMAAAARNFVEENFSLNRYIGQYSMLYDEILRERRVSL